MIRYAVVLALLLGVTAPAFAFRVSECRSPLTPVLRDVRVEVGAQLTSTGLYAVTHLYVEMQADPRTTVVRITLGTGSESTWLKTTPVNGRIDLAYPDLRAHVGVIPVAVEPFTADCDWPGEAASTHVVVTRHHAKPPEDHRAQLLFVVPFVAAAALGLALLLLARVRARRRAGTPPAPLSLPAAEHLARAVRIRALAVIGALAALAAYTATLASAEVVAVAFVISPTLLVLALSALVRLIDASRAIRLLRGNDVTAEVRRDQIDVITARHRVTLRASRWLVDRAREHALPRARL